MTTVVVEDATGSAEPSPGSTSELELEDAAEDLAEAAVEIAGIQADRDVKLAEIHAETEGQAIEASHDEELARLRAEVSECQTTISSLREELSLIRNPPEPVVVEILAEDTSSEPSPPKSPTSESLAVPSSLEVPGDGLPAQEPSPRRKKSRWI